MLENDKFRDASRYAPIVIAPGRFNPPHRGHKLIIDKLVALSEKLDAQPVVLIIDSGKYGPKNPLSGEVRKEYLQKMFPEIRFEVFKNAFEAVIELAQKDRLVPIGGVTGRDRGNAYKGMISQIFGDDIGKKYLSEVIHRDPDSDSADIKGISATRARQAAIEGDIAAFRAMTGFADEEAKTLMKLLVNGMETNGI
ncbi:hypothetical protein LCGC14_1233150 [marine sediment metagenome]|uniref:Cytidyltransferase-like domain-containing protein n=1 Tax=marine sediment metagenome TaxID=412755 RepID=A0A0F9NQ66_9ZZZZ